MRDFARMSPSAGGRPGYFLHPRRRKPMATFRMRPMRGGFWLSALGVAVVTPDGREASRWQAAARAVVAWSWVPITAIVRAYGGPFHWVLGIVGALAAFAVAVPPRGVQDRVTGTYLVPR